LDNSSDILHSLIENDGPSKLHGMKLQDVKLTDQK